MKEKEFEEIAERTRKSLKQMEIAPINELFERQCTKLGLTTNSLIAESFGVNPSTVSRWISGETPLPSWASKILQYLEAAIEAREKAINWQRKYNDLTGTLKNFKKALDNL